MSYLDDAIGCLKIVGRREAEEARAELATLRESSEQRTMFIRHVLEIAKVAGYETNCEMKAHKWLLATLPTLRTQASQLGPVVEALEKVVINWEDHDYYPEIQQTLNAARAAMNPETSDESE